MVQKAAVFYKNKFETVHESIKNQILNGEFASGDKLPTEYELTDIYGVNRTTISKVLSSLSSDGLIERKPRVGSVVVELSKRKPSNRLAAILMQTHGHLFSNLYKGVYRSALKSGYYPVVLEQDIFVDEPDMLVSALNELSEENLEFMVIDGTFHLSLESLPEVLSKIKNVIVINRYEATVAPNADFILSDYELGGYKGAKYLLDAGCKRIMVIFQGFEEEFDQATNSALRMRGVEKAYAEKGLEFNSEFLVYIGDGRSYVEESVRLFKEKKVDGIFAFADAKGRAVQQELEKEGFVPGKDYRLLGYYNTPWCTDLSPAMTSISIEEDKIAAKLYDILSKRKFDRKTYKIKPEIVERDT